MRWGSRVCLGQPDMKGHKARLGPETDKSKHKNQPRPHCPGIGHHPECLEFQGARLSAQQREGQEKERYAQMGGNQIDPACPPDVSLLLFEPVLNAE